MHCTPMYYSFFVGGFMKSIDLISFLESYYGIVNNDLKVNKLTHKDIKILLPNIKRMSFFELEKDKSLIYNGEVIMVHDCNCNILPYINPHLKVNILFDEYDCYSEKENIYFDEMMLDNLSKDELLKLRKKLKKNGQYFEQKVVTNAIRNKKDPKIKQYKRDKMKLRMEEF